MVELKGKSGDSVAIIVSIIIVCAMYLLAQDVLLNDSDYYGSNRVEYSKAPNGFYHVFIEQLEDPDLIWCALCHTAPTELHGIWRISPELEVKAQNWYLVALYDNKIVYVRKS